jgi:secreted PhoX family phosphatase
VSLSRRKFFTLAGTGAASTVLFSSLEAFNAKRVFAAGPYGALVRDPRNVLDLPAGFSYVRLSETGQTMTDGYGVPGAHDGMAAFPGPNGNTILVRNHELSTTSSNGVGAPNASKYDTLARGGTTTLEVTPNRTLVRHFGSLAGTTRNCAGGSTPWGSWLSCEETFETTNNKKHGYVFEVSASSTTFVNPVPLTAMGRFNHEAAAVDPNTGFVYMTEDRGDSCFYRFVPNVPGNLSAGGTLSALRTQKLASLRVNPSQQIGLLSIPQTLVLTRCGRRALTRVQLGSAGEKGCSTVTVISISAARMAVVLVLGKFGAIAQQPTRSSYLFNPPALAHCKAPTTLWLPQPETCSCVKMAAAQTSLLA